MNSNEFSVRETRSSGRLFICPTPIGNLQDASPRLINILSQVGHIACEDTRVTGKLRMLLNINTAATLSTYNDHVEREEAPRLIQCMLDGVDVALVCDAGTPTISDPGYRLVQLAWKSDIPIISVPGACAAVVALAASGLPTDRFRFAGFVPAKSASRRDWLKEQIEGGTTTIAYESPHRIVAFLHDLHEAAPWCTLYLGRELTKLNEEHLRGDPESVLQQLQSRSKVKGEIVVVIDFHREDVGAAAEVVTLDLHHVIQDLHQAGVSPQTIKKLAANWFNVKKGRVFEILEELKEK